MKLLSIEAVAESLGQEDYRLEVRAAGSKVSDARDFQIEVIRQKHRIMYLAGRPSFEYAQLREYLKSDPNHELVSFVILRNPENQIAVPDQDKVRMMNIEPLAFAYHDAKWAKRSFAQPGLNTFCREHGRILVPAT